MPPRPGDGSAGTPELSRALPGAILCLTVTAAIGWAVVAKYIQWTREPEIAWDTVPLAVEVSPDTVLEIGRKSAGSAKPWPLPASGSTEDFVDSLPAGRSRAREELQLLADSISARRSNRDAVRVADSLRPPALPVSHPPANAGESLPANPVPAESGPAPEARQSGKPADNPPPAAATSDRPTPSRPRPWQAKEDLPESPESPPAGKPGEPPPPSATPPSEPLPHDPAIPRSGSFQKPFSGHAEVIPSTALHPGTSPVSTVSGAEPSDTDSAAGPADSPQLPDSGTLADVSGESAGRRQKTESPEAHAVSAKGETLWTFSQRVYGDGNYFSAIYQLNTDRIEDVDFLPEGTRLRTPPRSTLHSEFPGLLTSVRLSPTDREVLPKTAVYRTQPGDTAFGIARQQLGQASRYDEILRLNSGVLHPSTGHLDALPEGLILKMPD